jgi:L-seryl-tRNA(Ser) seleniumtransferase
MAAMVDPRRSVPRTDTVLGAPELADALSVYGRDAVKAAVGVAQERVRAGVLDPDNVVKAILTELSRGVSLHPVINATGVIVHTNLGRAPLSAAARAALVEAAGSTDVEFDLGSGARERRGRGALAALAAAVPDAESVHVVNNNAAALLLCALALAPGREIVLSRGELVEIGDGFRIPELLMSAGTRLREVGTTNRTSLADYQSAIGPDTGFVLKVHPSNFQVTGFTASVPVADLAGLSVPVVADIGSGLLRPHPLLPDEPDAATMLREGAALVTASGDKLLGGPQAGLVLGRGALVERLRRHPAARALRVDKLTLAALEATLTGPTPPVVRALEVTAEQLRPRAERLANNLAEKGIDAAAVSCASAVGGGGAPGVQLASWGVSLPETYVAALRRASPPVVGYVRHGRCILDLRTVEQAEDAVVEQVILSRW